MPSRQPLPSKAPAVPILESFKIPEPADPRAPRRAAVLLAKAAITGAASGEMQALAQRLAASGVAQTTCHAFSEQGTPALRDVLSALADSGHDEVLLLPLLLPMEPGFRLWIARTVERWRAAEPRKSWPAVRMAPAPADAAAIDGLLGELMEAARSAPVLADAPKPVPQGSVVPAQRRRVLVCQGGPCNDAGAAVIWGHLRNEQKRLELRTRGEGVMSCKSSCLGPCTLAPVLQVFPEGTYYGGVDEAGIDRIVAGHLQGGAVVEALAYLPLPARQRLR